MLPVPTVAFAVAVLLVAGVVTGVAGFGLALIGTMALATTLSPAVAVVVMLVPILSTNLSLLRELDAGSLESCARRFWPYVAAAFAGTVAGMVLLGRLPDQSLTLGLGVLTLAYVATAQRVVAVPGLDAVRDRCFGESTGAKVTLGAVSGLLFGGTNVGVQVIAYLQSRDLSHRVFVGVVAMVFVGINASRIGMAAWLGLYPGVDVALLSVALAVPTLAGVAVGRRIRPHVAERHRRGAVLALLAVIGVRLVWAGL